MAIDAVVKAPKWSVVKGLEVDAGEFLAVEFFGEVGRIDPGSADDFEGESESNADVADFEFAK